MINKITLALLIALSLFTHTQAQQNESRVISIRSVLIDPGNLTTQLYATNPVGEVELLRLTNSNLSEKQTVSIINGQLKLYSGKELDPDKPNHLLAASVEISAKIDNAIVIVTPAKSEDTNKSYKMIILNDSVKEFPMGSSKVLNLIKHELALQAGEHRIKCAPGEITSIPMVKKVNEYHIAQTNFYVKSGKSWSILTENQLQHFDVYRRIFIAYATRSATTPSIINIVDTESHADPEQ